MNLIRIAFLAALVGLAAPAYAEDLSAQQIVDKTLERNTFGYDNAVVRLKLDITTSKGTERTRSIEMRALERDGLGKTLVRFLAPADVAGTVFLVQENKDRDNDQYLYLPAFNKVKRISGSQRDQKFMGTDFTYADMESQNLRKSKLQRLADTSVGDNAVYVIEAMPLIEQDGQYGKTVSYVHRESFVPIKIEFFDKNMKLLKVLTVARLEKRDTRWVVSDVTLKDVQNGSHTRMLVEKIDFSTPLRDSEFDPRTLSAN